MPFYTQFPNWQQVVRNRLLAQQLGEERRTNVIGEQLAQEKMGLEKSKFGLDLEKHELQATKYMLDLARRHDDVLDKRLTHAGKVFGNVNTPEEWEQAKKVWASYYPNDSVIKPDMPFNPNLVALFAGEEKEPKRSTMAQEALDLALAELGNAKHPDFGKTYRRYINEIFKAKQAQREKGLVQIQLGKPAPSQERESLNKLFEFKGKLTRIANLFDPRYVGRVQGGVLGAAREFFGVAIGNKEAMFRQIVKDIADTLLRLRSGAQINEQEYRRLTKLVPTVDLPDNVFLARLESLTDSIDESISIRQKTLKESGFRAPGQVTIKLEDMSDEDLLKIIGD